MGFEREFASANTQILLYMLMVDLDIIQMYFNAACRETCLLFKVGALLCIRIVAVFAAAAKDTWCKMSHFRPNSPTRLIRSFDYIFIQP